MNVPLSKLRLYHTTSLAALEEILKHRRIKPRNYESFVSFSEVPFLTDIRGTDAVLVFRRSAIAKRLVKVRYDEAWFEEHPEQGSYIAGEGWREQYMPPEELTTPPDDADEDWEPDEEEIEADEKAAEIESFKHKSNEHEWITKKAGEPLHFQIEDILEIRDKSGAVGPDVIAEVAS